MANLNISKRSLVSVVIASAVFADKVLTATTAETWPAGSVLATVTATGKMVRFNPAAAGGAGVPTAVLTEAVTFAGAGDSAERPLVSGQVRASTLVNDEGAALTASELDLLRSYGIIAQKTTQLSIADNE